MQTDQINASQVSVLFPIRGVRKCVCVCCIHTFHLCSQVSVCVCVCVYSRFSLSGCVLCFLPGACVCVCVWALHGHWLHSPEPSFHSEKAVAGKKKKKKLFGQLLFITNRSCCWLKRPGISSMEFTPFSTSQPHARTHSESEQKRVLQDLEVCRTKHLLWQRTRFSQPTYRPEEAGGLQQRGANLHPELWRLICLKINSSKRCFTDFRAARKSLRGNWTCITLKFEASHHIIFGYCGLNICDYLLCDISDVEWRILSTETSTWWRTRPSSQQLRNVAVHTEAHLSSVETLIRNSFPAESIRPPPNNNNNHVRVQRAP